VVREIIIYNYCPYDSHISPHLQQLYFDLGSSYPATLYDCMRLFPCVLYIIY
jgi:hypothetical protein